MIAILVWELFHRHGAIQSFVASDWIFLFKGVDGEQRQHIKLEIMSSLTPVSLVTNGMISL